MADFNALEALINAYIKQNGVQAITGQVLNGVLRGMVSALGKGWTVAGEAYPNTDPGTMTGPVAYVAHTAGTYTHFGGLVVNDGEVAFLKYNEQTWTKEVLASLAATASVDGNVGTPYVVTQFVNGVLNFAFHNMKGDPGINGTDGQDGAAAGFGTVSASVDNTVGTPAVSVQSSGPNTAKNFAFSFTGLKGETGVTSVVVTVDNTSGNPQCTASLNAGVLTLAFTGLKGAQGDTGSSVAYPFTLVNNLTTNDATQALTAAMGVQLESEITQLEAKVDTADFPLLSRARTFAKNNINDTTGAYSGNSNYATIRYNCQPNTLYKISNPSGGKLTVASSSSQITSGTFTHFVVSNDPTYLEYTTGPGEINLYINYWSSSRTSKTPGEALLEIVVSCITAKDQYSRSKIDSAYNGSIDLSKNLYDPLQHWFPGLNMQNTGVMVTGYSDRGIVYVPVLGLSKVTIAIKDSGVTATGCRYSFYTSENASLTGGVIGGIPQYGENNFSVIDVPTGAYYIGFLVYYAGCELDANGAPKCMVQSGDQYTGYVPYDGTEVSIKVNRPKDVYVCAKNSPSRYRNGADYCCDGVNDEVTIQAALDSVGTVGTLYLAPGIYYIDSFPQQTDGQYCAIQYKLDPGSSPERRVKIKCFDQTPMRQNGYSQLRRCATLHINTACYNALDENTQYSVIGCETSNGGRVWNGNILDCEGIAIEIPGNQKKIIAFDAYYAFCMMMFKCMATAIPNNAMPSTPGVDLCIGIRCTKGSNFGQESQINTCAMYGFGQGVAVMGEHYVITNAKTIYNKYGFTFNWFGSTDGGYSHPNTLINCCSEMDMNYPYFGQTNQGQSLTLIDFNMEHKAAAFALGGQRAKELVAGSWRGTIHYTIKVYHTDDFPITGNTEELPFWEDGYGKNMESVNDTQRKVVDAVSALASFAPNYNQIVYVTELNKPLICTNPATDEWRDFTGAIVPLS